jgi:hypothetical protein
MVVRVCNDSSQEDLEFQASLGYRVRPCLKAKQNKPQIKQILAMLRFLYDIQEALGRFGMLVL